MTRESAPRAPDSSRPAIAFAILLGVAWVVVILRMPERLLLSVVPDDAFYYLGVAYGRAREGRWSFDGLHPTTGYHLLHAFGLATLASVLDAAGLGAWRGSTQLVRLVAGLGVTLATLGSLLIHRVMRPALGRHADLALILVAAGAYPALAALNGLESAEAMVVSGLLLAFLAQVTASAAEDVPAAPERTGMRFVAAATLAPLVRTDLILLVVAACAAGLWVTRRAPHPVQGALRRTWALAGLGSAGAVALITAFCMAVTGRPTQDSGAVKRLWHEMSAPGPGETLAEAWRLLRAALRTPFDLSALGMRDGNAFWWALALVAVALVIGRSAPRAPLSRPTRAGLQAVVVALTLQLAALIAYYTLAASEVQTRWYFSSLQWGLAVAFAIPLVAAVSARRAAGAIVIACVIAANLAAGEHWASHGYWPRQQEFLAAGRWLARHPAPAPTAAWNAGILSWYSGQRVVNLDGVVNGDLHASIRRRAVGAWLDANGIARITDVAEMLRYRYVSAALDTAAFRATWVESRPEELPPGFAVWTRRTP